MSLGDLQQLSMLAVARLGSEAYGAAIQEELAKVADRQASVPTVYVTLIRLEERGLVRWTDDPPPEGQGGRARRVFQVTSCGWEALHETRLATDRMWQGVVHQ
jgi:PadR family transcriptional regulator, regulatory protein PadR